MTTLTELKPGCRLHVLFALAMTGAPLTKEAICYKISWSDEAVKDALGWMALPEQGLVLCIPNGRWPVWSLTVTARQMLLPIHAMLEAGDDLTPLPAESTTHKDAGRPDDLTPLPAESTTHKDGDTPKTPIESDSAPSGVRKSPTTTTIHIDINDGGILLDNFLKALQLAHVHHQLRKPLAEALIAEDGPEWLRQTLGWVASMHGETAETRGATIFPALKDRQRVTDSAYLPPPGMPFVQAMAWAERGGPSIEPSLPAPADDLPPAAIGPPPTDAEELLGQVLARLRLTTNARAFRTIESMLEGAEIAATDEPGVYTITARRAGAAAWLNNRMGANIGAEIYRITGRPATVTFFDGHDKP